MTTAGRRWFTLHILLAGGAFDFLAMHSTTYNNCYSMLQVTVTIWPRVVYLILTREAGV